MPNEDQICNMPAAKDLLATLEVMFGNSTGTANKDDQWILDYMEVLKRIKEESERKEDEEKL